MSDFPLSGGADTVRGWLDDNNFEGLYEGFEVEALLGQDKEDVLTVAGDKGYRLWGILQDARRRAGIPPLLPSLPPLPPTPPPTVAALPPTPGTGDPVFLLCAVIRKRARKPNPAARLLRPLGTAFAISDRHVLTAYHNVRGGTGTKAYDYTELVLLKTYRGTAISEADAISVTFAAGGAAEDEDWAVLVRTAGTFTHFVQICRAADVPPVNTPIGIRAYPLDDFFAGEERENFQASFLANIARFSTHVSDQELAVPPKKRKLIELVSATTPLVPQPVVCVDGQLSAGTVGGCYFTTANTALAFQVDVVERNGSHPSTSRGLRGLGLILCRIPTFVQYFSTHVPEGQTNPL